MSFARYATIVSALLFTISCQHKSGMRTTSSPPSASSPVLNLHAFARLYGVLRWFHPSDAASAIHWDRFAIAGARRVLDAPDSGALRSALAELIAPIAPTVQIVADDSFAANPAPPQATIGIELVAWQHLGYGDSTLAGPYASKRRHRGRVVAVPGAPSATLGQAIDAIPYRGARVRLRAKLRTAGHGLGRMWLRIDGAGRKRGFHYNMHDRPVTSETWTTAEIIGTVATEATRIAFGTIMTGGGTTWYDDIELSAETSPGVWNAIRIANPGFESKDLFASWRGATAKGWHTTVDHAGPASGKASLRMGPETKVALEELFADAPEPDEAVDLDLGLGLRARIPLSLYSKNGRTFGDDPDRARRSQTAPVANRTDVDPIVGVADVIVAWNALEHFWPYWDVVRADWNKALDATLTDALDDRTLDDHLATLQRLSAVAADSQSSVTCPGIPPAAPPPFTLDLIEGEIVVTATADKSVLRGDVIVSADGRPVSERLSSELALTSGSPQWRRVRALQQIAAGPAGSRLPIQVRRGTAVMDLTVIRGDGMLEQPAHQPIEQLDDGIYYIDLRRTTMDGITSVMAELTSAPGVVFDLRGDLASDSTRNVLSHLITKDIDTARGMSIPHVIRPRHTSAVVPSWRTSSAPLRASQPRIPGRVAFLTGPTALGDAENIMAMVEHHRLGAIVGGPTAGTNGNKAEIATPTGCRITFTAMRVTRPDGSPLHLVGVQPTIPASPTIAGVAAGRDEILEKAVSHLRRPAK